MSLEWQQVFVFALIVAIFAAFVWDRISIELVALGGTGVLLALGVLDHDDLLDCFSNPAPATIGALFILSASMERTGLIALFGSWFNRFARGSERRALLFILLVCPPLSAFVNNTPLVVVLMPMLLGFCRETGVKPSKLLIPLSFATILGGTCSMAGTSTNILVDGVARDLDIPGFSGFSLFDIAPLGIVYALVGGFYLWWFAPKLLPSRDTLSTLLETENTREFFLQALVPADSSIIGKTVAEAFSGGGHPSSILEIKRRGLAMADRLDEIRIEAGDRLLLRAGVRGVEALRNLQGLKVGVGHHVDLTPMEERQAVLMEGIIGPDSRLVGRTLREIGFRQKYGTLLLAIHREGVNITKDFENMRFAFGDTLLVEGSQEGINRLLEGRDFIALSQEIPQTYARGKAPIAIAGMALFIVLGASGVNTLTAAFLCALGVMLGGAVKPSEAYEAIDWKILFLIVGMIGIGTAMEKTGAAATLANTVAGGFAPFGPWVLLSMTYLLASVLTETLSNNAVAVVMTPLVVRLAEAVDASPVPFLVALMFGASASFATPIGYQTNTYVFGAGGYLFKDFVRIGLPLNVMLWVLATCLIPWIWPF